MLNESLYLVNLGCFLVVFNSIIIILNMKKFKLSMDRLIYKMCVVLIRLLSLLLCLNFLEFYEVNLILIGVGWIIYVIMFMKGGENIKNKFLAKIYILQFNWSKFRVKIYILQFNLYKNHKRVLLGLNIGLRILGLILSHMT